jgi:predicted RNase H-like nuclease (RuvC/YqgF family)
LDALKAQLEDAEARAKARESELESELANARNDLQVALSGVDDLEVQLAKARQESSELKTQLNNAGQKMKEAGAIVQKQRAEIETTKKDKDDYINTHANITKDELERLKRELEAAQETIEALRAELAGNLNLFDSVAKDGWLVKKSPNETFGQKFQRRWFVLKGNNLLYYKTPQDNMSKPAGSIFIENATVMALSREQSLEQADKSPWAFEVQQDKKKVVEIGEGKGQRVYLLVAATQEDRDKWIDAINKTKGLLEGRARKANEGRNTTL